jgi:hypothetical protein
MKFEHRRRLFFSGSREKDEITGTGPDFNDKCQLFIHFFDSERGGSGKITGIGPGFQG